MLETQVDPAEVRQETEAKPADDGAQKKRKKPNKAHEEKVIGLAENLLKVLRSQRDLGRDAYPLTLRKLADLADADPEHDKRYILDATQKNFFKQDAALVRSQDLDAPVALWEDVEQLVNCGHTLEFLLRVARTKTIHAHTASMLSKKMYSGRNRRLQKAFTSSVARRLESDNLPPTVGAIRDRSPKLFLLEDLLPASLRRRLLGSQRTDTPAKPAHAGSAERPAESSYPAPIAAPEPTETPKPAAAATPNASASSNQSATATQPATSFDEFARRFEEAFSRLDRQHGGYNFVSLAELRRELGAYDRAEFDRHLRRLREEKRFTLSGAQSKQGLSDEVREAGVSEAGHLLTYASRRK